MKIHFFGFTLSNEKPKPLGVEGSIKALVAKHGASLKGLYILERAYLRAHGTPKGQALIIPGGGTKAIPPYKTRKAKQLFAEGDTRPVTRWTANDVS